MTLYEHPITLNNGEQTTLEQYKGKVLLIVNTASKCGFTPQYEGLEALYKKYNDRGFEILGFPCDQFGHQEPGSDEDIAQFCSLNFGVSFPLFKKTNVNGPDANPLFEEIKHQAPGLLGTKRIKWNFTKFLVSDQGKVLKRFAPTVKPEAIEKDIVKLLKAQ
ncbi:glutathione peroxidase [Alteromonas portus]|uniref:Glutathione peroxidase n=1 Tax=Alteromonas portus TaxID=2565549 RepID=A0A4U0ZGM9_9ALTE|nr:glutathione peroxidase [Alteromonas portus]TKB03782.1 glutathione peroxidase [Alteromonas portus]